MDIKGKKIIATVTNPLFHDKRMERICSSLVELGAEVELVGVRRKNVPEPGKQKFKQVRLNTGFQGGFLFYASYNFLMFFYLLFKRFDILISVDLDSLPVGYLVAGIRSRKRVFDAHEFFTEVPEVERRPFVKWVWSIFARICIGKNNITVSNSLAKALEEKYGKSFEVIRNLPDFDADIDLHIKSTDGDDSVFLIYAGYLNEGRGLEYVIRALSKLPGRFKLILAGSGDLEGRIKEMTIEAALSDRIEFTGWIHPDDMTDYFERAHIGFNLLESRSASYYYSLANKTFDYMHFGIPCLHMNFPEYAAINADHDCFILCDELDDELIVKEILKLVDTPGFYSQKSSQNLIASKQHSWQEEKKRLQNYFRNLS